MIRLRTPADLDDCVRALRAVHEADGYPVNWPSDPGRWLDPPGTLAAWVFADPEVAGHVLVSSVGGASSPGRAGAASSPGEAGGSFAASSSGAAGPSSVPPDDAGQASAVPSSGEVGRLFVAPSHRGRGIGRHLVTEVREWAVTQGLGLVLEVVDDSRGAAIALYESTGWTHTGTSVADWTGPGGEPVQVRHYSLPCPG